MNKSVRAETHWMIIGDTVKLAHSNVVSNSIVSSHPVKLNYKEGTIHLIGGETTEGVAKVVISYIYEE